MANVALLANIADQTASQTTGTVSQLVPSGVILPFGGATAPAGWLLCDGTSLSRTTYANLFDAIGTAHGSVDANSFSLPDLRGRFLRGVDGGAARDPDRASRTAAATGGNTGDAVGSVQGTATKTPNTAFNINKNQWNSNQIAHSHGTWNINKDVSASVIGSLQYVSDGAGKTGATNTSSASWSSSNATVTGGGDNETRPLNANINYIIKV